MIDFTAARTNMVDSQIHTMGVTDDALLEAYRTVPRELFVPEDRRGIAYCDEDFPLGGGRALMEPVTHARLLQSAQPKKSDLVLDVGGATGYSAAILSMVASHVVVVETDEALLNGADQIWRELGISNIAPLKTPLGDAHSAGGPFDLIVVNGAIPSIPKILSDQLAPQGRIVAVIRNRDDRIGRGIIARRDGAGQLSERVLFDAAVPYLPGFEPRKEFVF